MRRRLGRCKLHRNHPSQPPTGWDDFAKPPLHHRTQSAGRRPGWRRKMEKAEARNGTLAKTLPFPPLPVPQSCAGLQTHWRKWIMWSVWLYQTFPPRMKQNYACWEFEPHIQYLGTRLISSIKQLSSLWGVSPVRMSEHLKAGGDSQMQSEISFSLTMASSSSTESSV